MLPRALLLSATLVSAFAPPAIAVHEVSAAQAEVAPARPREVLVLHGPESRESLRGESIYTATETVLNHLGLIVRYHDLSKGLPSDTTGLRGVISLVEGPATPDPEGLGRWLSERLDAGQAVYLLGGTAVLQEALDGRQAAPEAYQSVLSRLGVRLGTDVPPEATRLTALPGPHAAFEARYDTAPAYLPLANQDPSNAVFLKVRREDTGEAADMGLVGTKGGVAAGTACLFETNPLTFRLRWRVDPFWLLSRGLKPAGEPALDPTTLSGRRLFFAHIDGDGFANPAIMRGAPLSASLVKDEVLAKTWLPTTVSVVARELVGKPEREAIARALFRLPHVQAGSHTYTHPHDWELGIGTPEGAMADVQEALQNAPRAAIVPEREIDASVRYIQGLLPPGKRVDVMLWSGMTNPTEPFFARTAALGLPNLNGGDATLAPGAASYANLAPFGRKVGAHWQVYSAAANENIFTNLWTGPFDGQKSAIDLYRFSGSPRRMSAVNIYYHFYAAERMAGLKTLQALYRWAEGQPLCHVTTAQYARSVQGFYAGRLTPDGPDAWRVAAAGACRTLRFDDERRVPDLAASTGVAGYTTANGSLYVHLATADARVVLSARESGTGGGRPAAQVRLESASAPVAAWRKDGNHLAATFDGAAPITITLAGFSAGQAVRVGGDFRAPARADAKGRLAMSAPVGRRSLEVNW